MLGQRLGERQRGVRWGYEGQQEWSDSFISRTRRLAENRELDCRSLRYGDTCRSEVEEETETIE